MLVLDDISVIFQKGTIHERRALDHVSLRLEAGDFVCVLGSNGAGKSTLLHAVCGSLPLEEGRIFLDGLELTNQPEHVRARLIGHLFQDPMKGTAPDMTILENLALAYGRGKRRTLRKAIRRRDLPFFYEKLKTLGLGLEERMNQPVALLSGGQRQALTLLMATIVTPKLLLLDEHTAALDPHTAKQVMERSASIIRQNTITTLMITHDPRQALTYGNKLIVLREGRVGALLQGEEKQRLTQAELLRLYEVKN